MTRDNSAEALARGSVILRTGSPRGLGGLYVRCGLHAASDAHRVRGSGRFLDQTNREAPDADNGVLWSVALQPVADIGSRKFPLDAIFPDGIAQVRPTVTPARQIRGVGQRQERTEAVVSTVLTEFVHRHLIPMTWRPVRSIREGRCGGSTEGYRRDSAHPTRTEATMIISRSRHLGGREGKHAQDGPHEHGIAVFLFEDKQWAIR